MSFVEKVISVGTTDTELYTCPATQNGSAHGVVFSNTTAQSQQIIIKLYTQSTGLTTALTGSVTIAPNSQFTWPKPINLSAGDKILAVATNGNAITGVISIYITAAPNTQRTLNFTGEWSAVANYTTNDVVSLGGSSYIALADSTGVAPPSTAWMTLAEKGELGDISVGSNISDDVILEGGNIVMTGSETVDGRDVSADGSVIDSINGSGDGVVVKIADDTFARRVLTGTANQIDVTNGNGVSGNPSFSLADDIVFPGTAGIQLPAGNTASRPALAQPGTVRYNTETGFTELFEANGSTWQPIVLDNDLRFNGVQTIDVRKNPGKGQYSSIAAAMATITDSGPSKPYLIDVGPGVFVEPTINFKPSVMVRGSGMDHTIIQSSTPSQHLIEAAEKSGIESCMLTGSSTLGYAAVHCINTSGDITIPFLVHNCRFGENSIFVLAEKGYVIVDSCMIGGYSKFDYGFIARGLNGGYPGPVGGMLGWCMVRNTFSNGAYSGLNFTNPQAIFIADGIGCVLNIFSVGIRNSSASIDPNSIGLHVRNGSTVLVMSLHLQRFGKGLWVENVGAAGIVPSLLCTGVNLRDSIKDLVIDHPGTLGNFYGNASRATSSVADGVKATVFYNDIVEQGIVNVGPIYLGETHSKLVNVTDIITKTPPLGLLTGGHLSIGTGLNVGVASGTGYVNVNGKITKVVWANSTLPVVANTNNFVYVTGEGVVESAPSLPDSLTSIILGQYLSNGTGVLYTGDAATNINNFGNSVDKFNRLALGPIFVSGCVVTESIFIPRALDVSEGHYFYSTTERHPPSALNISFYDEYVTGGTRVAMTASVVNNTHYCDGVNLVAVGLGNFVKHTLYTVADGADVKYILVRGTAEYSTLVQAEQAPLATSLLAPAASPYIASIIVQEGNDNIVAIMDIRPRIGFAAPSASANAVHGNLVGLGSDDHKQYLLVDGTRKMTGDLDMNNNDLVNVATINGVDVDDHSARHQPNGVDALPTGAAVGLSASSTNSEGVANSFARSDHTHSLAGVQPRNNTLDGVASVTTNGLIARTGATTGAARTITGTSKQITVTNGDGGSGDPTISLPNDLVLPGTDGVVLPTGNSSQRPSSAADGTIRYNSQTGLAEFYQNGVQWQAFTLDNDLRFNQVVTKIVSKNPGKGHYSSIAAAMDAITDASASKPYCIEVGPGEYLEPTINAKQYVHILGSGVDITVIKPQSASQFLIECVERGALSRVTLTGCTAVGYAALHMINSTGDTNTAYNVENVRFGTNHIHGLCERGYVSINASYWGSNFHFDHGFIARGVDATTNARFLMRNCTSTGILGGVNGTHPQHMFWADGPKSLINNLYCAYRNGTSTIDPAMTGMRLSNGATTLMYATHIERWGRGIWTENTGAAPSIQVMGAGLLNNTYDLYLDHPGTLGSFSGIATRSKCHVADTVPATIFYTDLNNQGIVNVGPIYSGRNHSNLTDISTMLNQGFPLGILSGGGISKGIGLQATVNAGTGYLRNATGDLAKVSWNSGAVTLNPNQVQFIYADQNGILKASASEPNNTTNIIIGRTLTDSSTCLFASTQGASYIIDAHTNLDRLNKYAIGPIYVSGSVVSESATLPRSIDITEGFYFWSTDERHPVAVTSANIVTAYHASGNNLVTNIIQFPNDKYDNGTNLVDLDTGHYNKFTVYATGTGATAGYFMQYGTGNFATIEEARSAPIPPSFIPTEGKPTVVSIIVQQGNSNIVEIIDVRPRMGASSGVTSAGVSGHGDLTGLGNDDHVQYLLASGDRPMTGDLDMNGNNILNAGTVDGVNIWEHASRHAPTGADALPTAAPITSLSNVTTNSTGTANSFSRSDHTHALDTSVWTSTNHPTTVAGYGIADAVSAAQLQVLSDTFAASGEPTGIVNKNLTTITFTNGTRTFTIAPTGASFDIYVKGVKYTKTTTNIQIGNLDGSWFVYFDQNATIQTSQTAWDLASQVPIAIVYWNVAAQAAQFIAEERHGTVMDPSTHEYLHATQGTRYRNGLVLSNYTTTGTGTANADSTIGLSGGSIQDEDLIMDITHSANPLNHFEQVLNTVATIPVMRRIDGTWVKLAATNYPIKKGTSTAQYNSGSGSSWSLTDAASGNYVAMFIVATNHLTNPVVAVMGQREDTNLDAALKNNTWMSLSWGDVPFSEFKQLYRLVFQTDSSYTNATASRLVYVEDIRGVSSLPTSSIAALPHSTLTGLSQDDHSQYVHINTARTVTAQHTFNPASAAAPFVLGANAQGQKVTGLNADLLDGLDSTAFFPASTITGTAGQISVTNGNGAANPTIGLASGVATAGTYKSVTVDTYGRVTTGTNPTTVAGYGITNAVTNIGNTPSIQTGLFSARPSPSTVGRLYIATDTGSMYSDTGTTWVAIGAASLQNFGGNVAQTTGTSTIAYGTTAPASTDGTLLWQQSIAPSLTTNKVAIRFDCTVATNSSQDRFVTVAIFRGTTFIGAGSVFFTDADQPRTLSVAIVDSPATVSSVTYTCRIGVSAAASWYVNRTSTATLGGTNPAGWTIQEMN